MTHEIDRTNTDFWLELLCQPVTYADVMAYLPTKELRQLCEDRPSNAKSFVYQAIQQLELYADKPELRGSELSRLTDNAVKWLTRVVPFILDPSIAENFKEFWWDEKMALKLVSLVLRLLFCPKYTLNSRAPELLSGYGSDMLWGSAVGLGDFSHWLRREDLLKLLLCCLSQELQQRAPSLSPDENRWRLLICHKKLPGSSALCMSIIGLLTVYEPNSRPWLPYTDSWKSNQLDSLVLTSLQFLMACLCSVPIEGPPRPQVLSELVPNVYISALQNLPDSRVLAQGLHACLKMVADAHITYLPSSKRMPSFAEELVNLCLRSVVIRPDLVRMLCINSQAIEVVETLLLLAINYKGDTQRHGLVKQVFHILLAFSTDRDFCNELNQPYTKALVNELPEFTGSYADLLFLSYAQLLLSSPPYLTHLRPTFYITLANM